MDDVFLPSVGASIASRSLSGNPVVDFHLMKGEIVHHHYNPGYIVLSYLVSFVGCWTTLKLLHRRTSHRGYYNWYLLLAAAVSMGAVAIWAMHYIGNRAITMLDGQNELQIQYSAGYTGGSFFLPICVVSVAFYLLSLSEEVEIIRIAVVGLLTGAAVCGMHYLGQGGIANYYVTYSWPYVLGSACIAIIAATVALGVFFYLKRNWTNNWWKRALCAALLGAAVSGMHWVATVGTTYRLRRQARKASSLGRQGTVVIVLCLAFGCCIALMTFAVIGQRVKSRAAHQAQQVVLASVIFDTEGKLLVNPEGTLPSRKIAKTYLEETYDEIFDIDHPVFSWLYRASHYWPGVVELIPRMKAHLRATQEDKFTFPWTDKTASGRTALNSEEDQVDFGTTFKELFCVAASELAEATQEPLEHLGVLYESIMYTGTIDRAQMKKQKKSMAPTNDSLSNAEHGQLRSSFGRGQILFLVRQASKQDAMRLQAGGFGFAALTNIVPSLAHSMEVSPSELSTQLHRIQRSLSSESMLEPGVHLACYVLRPKFHGRWDVLINKDHKNLLPSVHLTQSSLSSWQKDIVKELDNMTASECYLYLQGRKSHAESQEEAFLAELDHAISSLAGQIDHPLFQEARLLARPFSIPCRTSDRSRNRQRATVVMFRVIADAHSSSPLNGKFEFGSSRLFRAQQHVYPRSPDHGAFARQVHLQFAGLAEAKLSASLNSGESSPRRPSSVCAASPEASSSGRSEREARAQQSPTSMGDVRSPNKSPTWAGKAHGFFGGIHVQREVSVDINEVEDHPETGREIELGPYGAHSEASVAPADIDTFADELMLLMMEERRQQSVKRQSS